MIKNIGCLFDLDGVLIDSESLYTRFCNEVEETMPTVVPDFAIKIKGSNLPTILNTYYAPSLHQAIIDKLQVFEDNMIYPIFPGVIDFLDELNKNSVPCAIVTSSSMDKVKRLFKLYPDFGQYFCGIITGDMVTHSKPNPECYLKGANAINREISNCYVFEDSIFGIQAGKAAGAHVIGLPTTLPVDKIKETEPEMIIDSFIGFRLSCLKK